MMTHDCDLCGSSHHRSIEAARSYIGDNQSPVVCMNCGFVYVRERRCSAEIAKAWDELWAEGYSADWPAVQARLYYVAQWCDQQFGWSGKSVLDIGAGDGTFLKFIRECGAHPMALEPCAENVRKIRAADIAALHGSAESVELGSYDVVTILWTLENCGDCLDMLRRAHKALNRSGRIVVATGSRILVPNKKPLWTYFSKTPADTHCFRFSVNSLKRALRLASFETALVNRFEDSDWLVAVGIKISRPEPDDHVRDDPESVLWFFDRWKHCWP